MSLNTFRAWSFNADAFEADVYRPAGAPVTPTVAASGGRFHQYDIRDPQHPYWRLRQEYEPHNEPIAEALPKDPEQRSALDDEPGSANQSPRSGADIIKTLLRIPTHEISSTPVPGLVPVSLSDEFAQREQRFVEELLLLELID